MILERVRIHYTKHNRKIDSGLLAFFLFLTILMLSSFSFMYFAIKSKLLVKVISGYIQKLIEKQQYNPLLNLINGNKNLFAALEGFSSSAYAGLVKILIAMLVLLSVVVITISLLKLYCGYQNKKDPESKSQKIKNKCLIDFTTFLLVFFGSFALTGIALIIPVVLTLPKSLVEFIHGKLDLISTQNNAMVEILKSLVNKTFKENDIIQKTIDKTRNTLLVVTSISSGICIAVILYCLLCYIESKKNAFLEVDKDETQDKADIIIEDSALEVPAFIQVKF